jgi:acetolactate synthase-1/2/3 large subunit
MDSIPLLSDACLGLDAVIAALAGIKPAAHWNLPTFKKKLAQWYEEKTGGTPKKDQPLRPQVVMDALNHIMTKDDIVVCDASLSSGWAASYLRLAAAGHRFLAPRGLAGLGWGTPAAIGAALAAKKEKRIFSIVGDGGFSYSVQELEVMHRLNLPVVTIVLNNDVLGWIKHGQKGQYHENYISCDFCHVDFATVARGFGARGYSVKTIDELRDALAKEVAPKGPVVIDIITDPWESPMISE